jgi:hypothetical protein
MCAMPLVPLSAQQLADSHTVFASFMGQPGGRYKTVRELLEIYRDREHLGPGADPADDLRVGRYIDDMASDSWDADVVLRIGVFDDTVLVIDGVHRAMAYLACVQDGVSTERLPALHVSC